MANNKRPCIIHLEDEGSISAAVNNTLPSEIEYLGLKNFQEFCYIIKKYKERSCVYILDDRVPLRASTHDNISPWGYIVGEAVAQIKQHTQFDTQDIIIYGNSIPGQDYELPDGIQHFRKPDTANMAAHVVSRIKQIETQDE